MAKNLTVWLVLSVWKSIVFTQSVLGQPSTGIVQGVIQDDNGTAVSFATVKLLLSKDSSLAKGTIADNHGKFQFTNVLSDRYLLSLTSISSDPIFTETFGVDSLSYNWDLGVIKVKQRVVSINEVVISGSKPLLKIEGDKLIVNIDKSFLAAGNTIIEVLRTLPGVNLSGDIKLNGKPAVILIDGKGQYSSRSVAEAISSLGAAQVESIELIGNPSSKYDANIQSIVNIKLKRERSYSTARLTSAAQLYPTPESSRINYGRLNPGINLNYSINKFSTITSIDFVARKSFESSNENLSLDPSHVEASSIRIEKENFIFYRSDNQYKTKNGIILGLTIGGSYNLNNYGNRLTDIKYISTALDSSMRGASLNQSQGIQTLNISAYFNRKLEKIGSQLDVIYDVYTRSGIVHTNHSNRLIMDDEFIKSEEQINLRNEDVMLGQALNVNLSGTISEKYKYEIGNKAAVIDGTRIIDYGFAGHPITGRLLNNSRFQYKENVLSEYFSISRSAKNYGIDIGGRVETVTGKSAFAEDERLKIQYTRFYPNLNLTYATEVASYRLSYTEKISRRPSYADLNPGTEYRSQLSTIRGNPTIMPQFTSQVQFTTTLTNKYTVTASMDIDRNIRSIVPMTESDNVFRFETVNVKRGRYLGLDINVPIEVTDWWSLNANGNLNNLKVSAPEYLLKSNSTFFALDISNTAKLFKDLTFQTSTNYTSKANYGFNSTKSISTTSVLLNYNLHNRASFSIRVNDIFGSGRLRSIYNYFNVYFQEAQAVSNQRSITARFTYNFKSGSKFSSVKKQSKNFGEIRLN